MPPSVSHTCNKTDGLRAVAKTSRPPRLLCHVYLYQRLKRVAKGRFCKPRKDALGDVPIGDDEPALRDVLHRNGRRVGYINGPAPYNRVGLTTQVFAGNKFDAVLHI